MGTNVSFTPGPWAVDDRVPLRGHGRVIMAGSYGIAKVWDEPNGERAQNAANARLIAAAPDLLTVVAKLDAWWTKDMPAGPEGDRVRGWPISDDTRELWREMRAALARTTSPNPDPNTAPSQADRAGGDPS